MIEAIVNIIDYLSYLHNYIPNSYIPGNNIVYAMAKMKIEVDGYKCERCSHEWVKRKEKEPTVCPKCKSPYWNIPRKE